MRKIIDGLRLINFILNCHENHNHDSVDGTFSINKDRITTQRQVDGVPHGPALVIERKKRKK